MNSVVEFSYSIFGYLTTLTNLTHLFRTTNKAYLAVYRNGLKCSYSRAFAHTIHVPAGEEGRGGGAYHTRGLGLKGNNNHKPPSAASTLPSSPAWALGLRCWCYVLPAARALGHLAFLCQCCTLTAGAIGLCCQCQEQLPRLLPILPRQLPLLLRLLPVLHTIEHSEGDITDYLRLLRAEGVLLAPFVFAFLALPSSPLPAFPSLLFLDVPSFPLPACSSLPCLSPSPSPSSLS